MFVSCPRAQVTQTALIFFIMARIYTSYKHGEAKAQMAEETEKRKKEEARSLLTDEANRMIVKAAEAFLGGDMGKHINLLKNKVNDREHV